MSSWNERMLGGPSSQSDDYAERHIQPFQGNNRSSFAQSITQPINRGKLKCCGILVLAIILIVVIVPVVVSVTKTSSSHDDPGPPGPAEFVYVYRSTNQPINGAVDQAILVLPDEYGYRPELVEVLTFYVALGYNVHLIDYFFGQSIQSINQPNNQSNHQSINHVINQSIDETHMDFLQRFPLNQSIAYARDYLYRMSIDYTYQSIQLIAYGYGGNVALNFQLINQSSPIDRLIDSVVVAYPWTDQSINLPTNRPINQPHSFIVPALSKFAQNVTDYETLLGCQINKPSTDQSIKPSTLSTDHLIKPSTDQSINQANNQSINQSVDATIYCMAVKYPNQVDGFSINLSTDQSINQNKTQSHADTLKWLLTHGRINNQSINQPIKQGVASVIGTVPIYITEPFLRPTPSINPSVDQSIDQSTNEVIEQSVDQSINRPTLLYLPDIYGDRFESRSLVDFYANVGYRTLLVNYDLVNRDMNRSIAQTYEIVNILQADVNPPKMIALGFCWGGKVAVELASNSSAVVSSGTAHPSRLGASDAPLIEQPIYFSMASSDDWTKIAEGWPLFDAVLTEAQISHAGKIFQQRHGWTQSLPTSIPGLIDKFVALTEMLKWVVENAKQD